MHRLTNQFNTQFAEKKKKQLEAELSRTKDTDNPTGAELSLTKDKATNTSGEEVTERV